MTYTLAEALTTRILREPWQQHVENLLTQCLVLLLYDVHAYFLVRKAGFVDAYSLRAFNGMHTRNSCEMDDGASAHYFAQ